ncbi:cysteine/serine endopeptidase inhibitor [Actinoplanes sp. G11-F43]|uniref:cysteine/serine endopeptidase inhibitor n=1 Tax=Actinoplanes sp. G11-F43 TaxID=3424130 RepID=UPI003D34AAA6
MGRRILLAVAVLFAVLLPAGPAAAVPIGQVMTGKTTFYNDAGYGSCGTPINAATEMLVAVSHTWWTTANPNLDPICQGIGVEVTYNGRTITVPVKDKCPSCAAGHIDLSQAAFARFASVDPSNTPGVLPVTWKFVNTDGGGGGGRTGPITGLAGKCIGAAGGNTAAGTAVDLYSCVGDATQRWTLPGDGTIRTAGRCLDVSGSGTADGTRIQLWDCNGTGAQQWVFSSARDLVNPNAGKCLDLTGGSSADFTVVQLWTCNGTGAQKWTIP